MQQHSPSEEKQAACFECRRSKIKCVREPGVKACKKCQNTAAECVAPEYHIGRYKGTKNKRTGLEKAISRIEQAVKRTKRESSNHEGVSQASLEQLLLDSRQLSDTPTDRYASAAPSSAPAELDVRTIMPDSRFHYQPDRPATDALPPRSEPAGEAQEIAVQNADNPLQLLAMASTMPSQTPAVDVSPEYERSPAVEHDELDRFFHSMQSKLDIAPELDPIEMGLVSNEEARILFKYFFENLSHTRWGLDPILHTTDFVRSRSAYLFTSILAATALFLPDAAALSKRLANHRDKVLRHVIADRCRSVEIVVAFMVNVPWMVPAKCWSEDDTCNFLAHALVIALDLSLNKIVTPSPTIRSPEFDDNVSKADCIEAAKALQLDGYPHVAPTSTFGKRLLRTRERAWLALFVLDRGVCLARGRPYTVPPGPLVDSCDSWHVSDIADKHDADMISMTVLRRDLVGLIASVRETCNSTATGQGVTPATMELTVKFLKDKIDRFFDHWTTVWALQSNQATKHLLLPPYVEILATHTQLSTYCSVINHPTASSSVKDFFRAAGLKAALNVMRVAVEGEARLQSMPNNTVIMISFAACFALGLCVSTHGDGKLLAPNAISLVLRTAQVLERIGNVTRHRCGTSTLFGRHIRRIASKLSASLQGGVGTGYGAHALQDAGQRARAEYPAYDEVPASAPPPPVRFSASASASSSAAATALPAEAVAFDMTDDQIIEAINNANASREPFQLDESMFLDWFEWPNVS